MTRLGLTMHQVNEQYDRLLDENGEFHRKLDRFAEDLASLATTARQLLTNQSQLARNQGAQADVLNVHTEKLDEILRRLPSESASQP